MVSSALYLAIQFSIEMFRIFLKSLPFIIFFTSAHSSSVEYASSSVFHDPKLSIKSSSLSAFELCTELSKDTDNKVMRFIFTSLLVSLSCSNKEV